MAEWIYFLNVPREDFANTMTEDEERVWDEHFERLKKLFSDGILVMAGPTLGRVNTGLVIFEADDEEAARRIMEADPAIVAGFASGELRQIKLSLLRGRH
jgi:uncharacterized protein YciI